VLITDWPLPPSAALRRDIAAEYDFYANMDVDDSVEDYDPSYGSMDYQKQYPEVYDQHGQYEAAGMDREGRMPYNRNGRNGRTADRPQGGNRGSALQQRNRRR
jgi:hypothetical protein